MTNESMEIVSGFDALLGDENAPAIEEQVPQFTDEDPVITPSPLNEGGGDPVNEDNPPEDNGVYAYLKSRGVSDPSRIKFEDDNGEVIERDFNDLTAEEQSNILRELGQGDYSDEENTFIKDARLRNLTPNAYMQAYAEQYAKQMLDQYIKTNTPEPTYEIDQFSDVELYAGDLINKYPSLTEDEIKAKVEAAQENPELFAKEVADLRATYKKYEEQQVEAAKQREQADMQALQDNLRGAINNFNGFYLDYTDPESDSIEIEDGDKEDIYSYITKTDASGMSQLAKDLNDPNTLVELAWLRTKGADLLANVTRYWKDELSQARKENARLQKEVDKLTQKTDKSIVVPREEKSAGRKADMGSL